MLLFGLQTNSHSLWSYLIWWTPKFNIKKGKYVFIFLPPFYGTRLWLGGRTKIWCMKKHEWLVFKLMSHVGGIIWSSHFPSGCHRNAMKILYTGDFYLRTKVTNVIQSSVINIDTLCSTLHQHRLWVASKTRGCVSAVSPCFMLQLSCTGSQVIASAWSQEKSCLCEVLINNG